MKVDSLSTVLDVAAGELRAVDGISFELRKGECFALVGESGCGKSMTALSLMRLLPEAARIAGGHVDLDGVDLLGLPEAAMRAVRGKRVSMIFQEPATALNPVLTVGQQISEVIAKHSPQEKNPRQKSIDLLKAVGLPDPEQRYDAYPFQLSGGQRQRVMIAGALAVEPEVLIADEPTTALDVTIQAQILDLLAREQRRRHMAMIIITHDLGVVAGRTDEVAVMYAGRVVERAPTPALFKKMRMPYTEALLAALPRLDAAPHTPLPAISGRPPDPTRPLQGCSFSPRCRYAVARCQAEKPALESAETSAHQFACFHPIDVHAGAGA